jgi:hypothetical protein
VAGVESLLLLLVCAYMTNYYAAKERTPFYVIVLTILSLFLSFMLVFVVPLDIYTVRQKYLNFIKGQERWKRELANCILMELQLLGCVRSELVHFTIFTRVFGSRRLHKKRTTYEIPQK